MIIALRVCGGACDYFTITKKDFFFFFFWLRIHGKDLVHFFLTEVNDSF